MERNISVLDVHVINYCITVTVLFNVIKYWLEKTDIVNMLVEASFAELLIFLYF